MYAIKKKEIKNNVLKLIPLKCSNASGINGINNSEIKWFMEYLTPQLVHFPLFIM